jgi:hypothetical protein
MDNFDHLKNISGLAGALNIDTLTHKMNSFDLNLAKTISPLEPSLKLAALAGNFNQALFAKSNVDLLLSSQTKISALAAAMSNVVSLLGNNINPITQPYANILALMTNKQNDALKTMAEISGFTSALKNFDWQKNYPQAFTNSNIFVQASEITRQFERLERNIDNLNVLTSNEDDKITFSDALIVSLNLDFEQSETIDPEIEKIFEIANQAFEKLDNFNENFLDIFKKLYIKLSKFVNHPYTVGIVLILANYYFVKYMDSEKNEVKSPTSLERVISEKCLGLKLHPIKNSKDFVVVPIGSEIIINERKKVWATVSFINSNGILQIGYIRIDELEKVSNN